MKINIVSLHPRFLVAIALLICFGLSAPTLYAQTFMGQPMLTESPNSLRTIITPVGNSSVVRVRFENAGHGPVQMQIRDRKGTILLDESQPKRAYAGQFDLASLPAGLYTIELRTPDARHTQTIRIDSPTAGRIVVLSQQTEPAQKLVANQ